MFGRIKHFDPIVLHFLIATFLMGLSNGMFDAVYNFYLEARGIDKTAIGYICNSNGNDGLFRNPSDLLE